MGLEHLPCTAHGTYWMLFAVGGIGELHTLKPKP